MRERQREFWKQVLMQLCCTEGACRGSGLVGTDSAALRVGLVSGVGAGLKEFKLDLQLQVQC